MTMCYDALDELRNKKPKETGGRSDEWISNTLKADSNYQALMIQLEKLRAPSFPYHPKMDRVRSLLIDYFVRNEGANTKAMVFTSFRHSCEELVQMLEEHAPIIKPIRFVGQSNDKKGAKGMTQKQQLEVCWYMTFVRF